MSKCEWKARQVGDNPAEWYFESCGIGQAHGFDYNGKFYISATVFRIQLNYCPYCGADIRKPEPEPAEPLIVKSGEAWVAYQQGVDYLWTSPITKNAPWFSIDNIYYWKSFTGPNPNITELTDEIAKLRPMVFVGFPENEIYGQLFGYNADNSPFTCLTNVIRSPSWYRGGRLATAKELLEVE